MKKVLRISLSVIFMLAFAAGMGVLLHIVAENRHAIACSGIQIEIAGSGAFVTKESLQKDIDNFYGIYVGQRIEEVRTAEIERMVSLKPAVQNCEVWVTDDGLLHVHVCEREPVLRFDSKGKSTFVDRTGMLFPPEGNKSDSLQVLSISCDPARGVDSKWLEDLLAVAERVSHSKTWSERINGYAIEDKGDLVLLAVSGERLIYGDFSRMDAKFDAMERYFTQIAPNHTDSPYKSVNVKYKGQIICRKDS